MHCRRIEDIPRHEGQHLFSPSRVPKPSIFEQSPQLAVCNLQHSANSGQFATSTLTTAQASAPITLIPNTGTALPLDDQRNFIHHRISESNYYPLTSSTAHDFPLNCTTSSFKKTSYAGIPSLLEEHDYSDQEKTAQHSQSLPILGGDFYDMKDDTSALLIYDPSLYLQHFDQNEIFGGPFMEVSFCGFTHFPSSL